MSVYALAQSRRQAWLVLAGMLLLCLLLLFLSTQWHGRWDASEGQQYSLSDSSRGVLQQLDKTITIHAYLSKDLPQPYGRLQRFIVDMLASYRQAGGGHLVFDVKDPSGDAGLEKELELLGVPKIQVQTVERDQAQIKQGWLALVLEYDGHEEAIPMVQGEQGFEYMLTRKIKRMIGAQKPRIGLAGSALYQTHKLRQLLIDDYELVDVDLEKPFPESLSLILLGAMRHAPSAEVVQRLQAYRQSGGNLWVLAANAIPMLQRGYEVDVVDANANDWLKKTFSVLLESGLVLDQQAARTSVRQRQGMFTTERYVDYPFVADVRDIASQQLVCWQLQSVFMPFAAPLEWFAAASEDAQHRTLLRSSAASAVQQGPPFDISPLISIQDRFQGLSMQSSRLLVSIEQGQSRVLIASSAALFDDAFIRGDNLIFVLNGVDWLAHHEDLIALRSKGAQEHPLDPLAADARLFWKILWMLLMPLAVVFWGLWHWRRLARRQRL